MKKIILAIMLLISMSIVFGDVIEQNDYVGFTCNNATSGVLLGTSATISCKDSTNTTDFVEDLLLLSTGRFNIQFTNGTDTYTCFIDCATGAVDYDVPLYVRTTPLIDSDNIGLDLDDTTGDYEAADFEDAFVETDIDTIIADTEAQDTSGELRTLMYGADLPGCTNNNVTTILSDTNAILVDTAAQDTGAEMLVLMKDTLENLTADHSSGAWTTATVAGANVNSSIYCGDLIRFDEDNTAIDIDGTTIGTVTTAGTCTDVTNPVDLNSTLHNSINAIEVDSNAQDTAAEWLALMQDVLVNLSADYLNAILIDTSAMDTAIEWAGLMVESIEDIVLNLTTDYLTTIDTNIDTIDVHVKEVNTTTQSILTDTEAQDSASEWGGLMANGNAALSDNLTADHGASAWTTGTATSTHNESDVYEYATANVREDVFKCDIAYANTTVTTILADTSAQDTIAEWGGLMANGNAALSDNLTADHSAGNWSDIGAGSSLTAAQIDAQLNNSHPGNWSDIGAGSSLTAAQIDTQLNNSHGKGTWTTGTGTSTLTTTDIDAHCDNATTILNTAATCTGYSSSSLGCTVSSIETYCCG